MIVDGQPRIDAIQATNATPRGNTTQNDTADFRRLLESLEQLAKEHRTTTPLKDAGAVQEAMARADEGFSLAMDLRQRLEEAFRQREQ